MYIPVRVASLTDLILAACGSAVGVFAQERMLIFYHFSSSTEAVRPEARGRGAAAPEDLSPTDALIASLMDPYTEAPAEHVPTRTPKAR